MPDVISKVNETLTKLGASTTIPLEFTLTMCNICGVKHIPSSTETAKPVTEPVVKTVTEPVTETVKPGIRFVKVAKKVIEPVTEAVKPVTETVVESKKEEPYNPEMALFLALAKKHDAQNAIANPTKYFSYYEQCYRRGSTIAEKMESYFSWWSSTLERAKLMKSLFEQNNLAFCDAAMNLYDEWVKTYTPSGKTNRYKKMCAFIDVHKSLFTA
jgi:hypothetical protein